jgi:hypothetical protein
VVLAGLDINDYTCKPSLSSRLPKSLTFPTVNFATYYIWAGAEITVAMICLGIPTLRPLYLKTRGTSIGYADTHDDDSSPEADDPESPPRFTMSMREQKNPPSSSGMGHDIQPQTPDFRCDSASSHTVVQSFSSSEPILPRLARPAGAHTRLRSDPDSVVDDILGLYDERRGQQSRRMNKVGPGVESGGIWVRNEISIDSREWDDNWPLRT